MDPLSKLDAILSLVDTKSNAEEFVQAFDEVLKVFLAMKADNEAERADLKSFADTALKAIQDKAASFTSALFEKLTSRINEKLATIENGKDGTNGTNGADGKDADEAAIVSAVLSQLPPDVEETAEQTRDKLESLTGDDRLDASAIKNLPKGGDNQTHVIGGHGPLWGLQDVDVSGIVAGQSIEWDGTRWIPYTPVGGASTSVFGENLTSQGPGTSYTLAHTPLANTLRLYRGGSYQLAGTDYTVAAAVITLTTATQTGEVLVSDYNY